MSSINDKKNISFFFICDKNPHAKRHKKYIFCCHCSVRSTKIYVFALVRHDETKFNFSKLRRTNKKMSKRRKIFSSWFLLMLILVVLRRKKISNVGKGEIYGATNCISANGIVQIIDDKMLTNEKQFDTFEAFECPSIWTFRSFFGVAKLSEGGNDSSSISTTHACVHIVCIDAHKYFRLQRNEHFFSVDQKLFAFLCVTIAIWKWRSIDLWSIRWRKSHYTRFVVRTQVFWLLFFPLLLFISTIDTRPTLSMCVWN